MKFKISTQNSSEHEKEFDTAVDIVNWSCHTTDYRLESSNGLVLNIINRKTYTKYSYLEADYDEFEKDPENNILHKEHKDSTKDTSTNDIWMTSIIPEKIVTLEKKEFVKYFENFLNKNNTYILNYFKGDSVLLNKLEAFERQQSTSISKESSLIETRKEDLLALLKTLENVSINKNNQSIEIDLPNLINEKVITLSKQSDEINHYNSENFIKNLSRQANAILHIAIENLEPKRKMKIS